MSYYLHYKSYRHQNRQADQYKEGQRLSGNSLAEQTRRAIAHLNGLEIYGQKQIENIDAD